jgi:hypothetical protein
MVRKSVSDEVAAAERMLRDRIGARDALNTEILQLQEKLRALHKMYFTDELAQKERQLTAVGLTEAIRILLRKHGRALRGADIKLGLEILGFDLERFQNPSAAIHSTLIRMYKTGELYYDEKDKSYGFPGAAGVPLLNAFQKATERNKK